MHKPQRKVLHIDMDAFFASVEQRDHPEFKGKPVVVGGDPSSRGVVCTCSYEARSFGIHSAMPTKTAYRLCPEAIFVRPRFDAYVAASLQVKEIFNEYTDLVEPLSLDEAYLDVTRDKKGIGSGTLIAQEIRKKIFEETQLTASAGVSFNKFLAKIASDLNKPDGIAVIAPTEALAFVDSLPIRKFYGIGEATEKKMRSQGIRMGRDLRERSLEELVEIFGKMGKYYYQVSRGIDERPVTPHRERKSIGKETTFSQDLVDVEEIFCHLKGLSVSLDKTLCKHSCQGGRTITLKVRYADFRTYTRSVTLPHKIDSEKDLFLHSKGLLEASLEKGMPIRLLGISLSNFFQKSFRGQMVQMEFPF